MRPGTTLRVRPFEETVTAEGDSIPAKNALDTSGDPSTTPKGARAPSRKSKSEVEEITAPPPSPPEISTLRVT